MSGKVRLDDDDSSSSDDGEHQRCRRQRPESYYDHPKDLKDHYSLPKDPKQRAKYLGKAAHAVNAKVFQRNTEKIRQNYPEGSRAAKTLSQEERMDCISISVAHDGKTGVLAGNVKERDAFSRKHKKYDTYGLDEKMHKDAIKNAFKETAPELQTVNFDVIGNVKTPTNRVENAKLHAEMQQVSYGVNGDTHTMGVSKAPCTNCDSALQDHGFTNIGHPEGSQNLKPKNWQEPEVNNNPVVEKKFGISSKKVFVDKSLGLKTQNESVSSHVASNIRRSAKPRVNASAQSMIETIVEDFDREPGTYVDVLDANAGTYEGKRMWMRGAYARASTFDAQAHAGPCHARVNGPAASAGVHASVVGVGAYANAELARAEASALGVTAGVGLNFNTGVSAGVDGLSASFLGFGASLGPNLAVRTPVVDASCCIM